MDNDIPRVWVSTKIKMANALQDNTVTKSVPYLDKLYCVIKNVREH